MLTRLSGKVAGVTGGAQGIGYAIARRLYEDGASVVIADLNGDGAARAAREIGGQPGATGQRTVGLAMDISRRAQARAMVERVTRELGSLDILVNNAGVGQIKPLHEITEREWDWIFDV